MDLALEVFDVLSEKRLSRELPFRKNDIIRIIENSILEKIPIKLVGFWGVGNKNKSNWADLKCCEFLKKMQQLVEKIYPTGLNFTFVISVEHGIHNGISKDKITSYTKNIELLLEKFSFNFVYLEKYWKKYGITFEKVDKILESKQKDWWNVVENKEKMEKAAEARNFRLRKKGAQGYFIFRNLEKEFLEKEFRDSIFFTFTSSEWKNVLPDTPTLYLYSLGRKQSEAPWFITKD